MTGRVEVTAPDGVGEVRAGADLATLLLDAWDGPLRDGDVVVVTSKVVSKAEGRVLPGTREEALPGETARVVARRGPTTIVRTRHGLTMAAAGIDASNVAHGSVVLLPLDPDASARAMRRRLQVLAGVTVGVVVTDTAGRAWRQGQTDIAIGAAGLRVLEDFTGAVDAHGNPLVVTAPAVADEVAGAVELASGKLGGRPFAVVRGRGDLVLPADEDGPGAAALVRPEGSDLFGYGAREAVVRALGGAPADRAPFGAPATAPELLTALEQVLAHAPARPAAPGEPDEHGFVLTLDEGDRVRVGVLAFALGWVLEPGLRGGQSRLRPAAAGDYVDSAPDLPEPPGGRG